MRAACGGRSESWVSHIMQAEESRFSHDYPRDLFVVFREVIGALSLRLSLRIFWPIKIGPVLGPVALRGCVLVFACLCGGRG